MSRRSLSTLPQGQVPAVVAVAPSPLLLAACQEAARRLDGAMRIESSAVKDAATTVARWRPFALVLGQELFGFDPEEFRALARDVSAEIVMIDALESEEALVAALLPRLQEALLRWEERAWDMPT